MILQTKAAERIAGVTDSMRLISKEADYWNK